jgi:hypothetical protein
MLWAVEKQWVFYIMGWASIFFNGPERNNGLSIKKHWVLNGL